MRRKNSAYLVLALILLIVIVVLCLVLITGRDRPAEAPAPSAAPATPAPPRDTPPGAQPIRETEAPAATIPPAGPTERPEEPVETRPPLETEEPVPAGSVDVGGSFRSDTGTYLNLLVNWSAKGTGETVPLRVELCAESYSLHTVASYGNLELTVNGVTYRGDSPAISCDAEDLTVTPLDSFTVEVPRGDVSISAVWHFKGSYSGKELETITASVNAFVG